MSDFLKMDVFFAVATIATVVLSLLAAAALYYLIRVLRRFERICDGVLEEFAELRTDFKEARASAKRGIQEIASLLASLTRGARKLVVRKKGS